MILAGASLKFQPYVIGPKLMQIAWCSRSLAKAYSRRVLDSVSITPMSPAAETVSLAFSDGQFISVNA